MVPVVYESETRSLMVRRAIGLKVFEDRLLSRINEKRVEVRREWE
jgi:hypothetical protein